MVINVEHQAPDVVLSLPGSPLSISEMLEYPKEYPTGEVTHQRFIEGGVINGTPNQRVAKVL